MAFNKDYLARETVALNTGSVVASGSEPAASASWTYRSADDDVATIVAANYFAEAVWQLSLTDWLFITGSDAVGVYVVSAIDRAAGTISVTAASITGVVDTANIADGAVTNAKVNAAAAIAFSKLEPMTSGNILVGSVADVATEVTMSGDVTIVAAGTTAIGANKVLSAMMSPLLLKYATVSISASAFNGMYVTPIQLVAAGGANTLLVLESVDLVMTYGSAQYANGGVIHVQYANTTLGAGIIASSTQAAANVADAASTALHFNAGIVKQPLSTAVNLGLFLSNVSGAFDTGDSTFVAHVRYYQLPTV